MSKQLWSKLATTREPTRQRRSCRRKDKLKEGRNSTAQRERNEKVLGSKRKQSLVVQVSCGQSAEKKRDARVEGGTDEATQRDEGNGVLILSAPAVTAAV